MAYNKTKADYTNTKLAVSPNAGTADTPVTGIKVDSTGYHRAKFTFNFGLLSGSANLSAGCGVWAADTSGGTFARMTGASLAAISSGAISSAVAVIDVKIDVTKPWLLVSGMSMISSACLNAASVELYTADSIPPTVSSPTQVVTAN
jgi:hypothetical protein